MSVKKPHSFFNLISLQDSLHCSASGPVHLSLSHTRQEHRSAPPILKQPYPIVSNCILGLPLEGYFTAVASARAEEGEGEGERLYVTHRHQHYPMLHVRPALVEDNDDLEPILRQCSGNLTTAYGMCST